MQKITIAFDIDGTLLDNVGIPADTPVHLRPKTSVNLEMIVLLQLFKRFFKNVKIIIWSGGGKEYAENIVRTYGLTKYVSGAYAKGGYDGVVHIAIDDVHACNLGAINLIVKMK